jgi:stress-induced morphogen
MSLRLILRKMETCIRSSLNVGAAPIIEDLLIGIRELEAARPNGPPGNFAREPTHLQISLRAPSFTSSHCTNSSHYTSSYFLSERAARTAVAREAVTRGALGHTSIICTNRRRTSSQGPARAAAAFLFERASQADSAEQTAACSFGSPKNAWTHYKVILVSNKFDHTESDLGRQERVNAAFAKQLREPSHQEPAAVNVNTLAMTPAVYERVLSKYSTPHQWV